MLSDDIGQVIRDYYTWAAINSPDDIGYPHIDQVRKLLGGSVGSVRLSDDEAVHVDRALGRLSQESPRAHRVLHRMHMDKKGLRWMEKNGEGDRRTNARLAAEAEQFIKGALFGASV